MDKEKNHCKIAFLFLTIGELRCEQVWKQFFQGIDPSMYSIYNHAKYRDRISSHSILHGHHISHHISTQWAHNSLVRATIFLLQDAMKDPLNTFFVLCSESCIPIVHFFQIHEFLQEKKMSFFCFNPRYTETKDCEKRYLRFQGKEWIPSHQFLKADQWFILHRDAAVLCSHGYHVDDFDRVFASDEHYFINMIHQAHLPYENRWSTFSDYELDRSHPLEWKQLSQRFLDKLRKLGFFFLRKVHSQIQFIS